MPDLEYLKKTSWEKFVFNLTQFFKSIPIAIWTFLKAIPLTIWKGLKKIGGIFATLGHAMKHGDWKTRTSFFVMGFGQLTRKQIMRGILYLGFQILYILFMVFFGWKYLAKLGSLGEIAMVEEWDDNIGAYVYHYYDNSLLILLYSMVTIFISLAFIYTWYMSVKTSMNGQEILEIGKTLPDAKADVRSLLDDQYYKTLLAIPIIGLVVFTVLPIVFMILIAFTNFDATHMPPSKLFSWVGIENFVNVLGGGIAADSKKFAFTFGGVLLWTLIWAFFATFTNYVLGMVVALLINKKGIKFKKLWRTILILTVAVPQFVSLMLMSQMLTETGVINRLLINWGLIQEPLPFLTNTTWARCTIIIVNIWIGIPFTMLICTGLLMNIPADLYESARIDGASPFKMYMKITLPYMLHVTTPYLITQFVGNINNFNVIFLLSGGYPASLDYMYAGETDLLITWLYKLTFSESNYKVASVIGILTFVVVGVISLLVYNNSGSVKNEEEFM